MMLLILCINMIPYTEMAGEVLVQRGGAVASIHSNITIIDSIFEGNSAQLGGAIFCELDQRTATLQSSTASLWIIMPYLCHQI